MEYKSGNTVHTAATSTQAKSSLDREVRALKEKLTIQDQEIRSISAEMRQLKNELRMAVNRFNLISSGRS